MVDQSALALGLRGNEQFREDVVDVSGIGLNGTGQRIAAERTKPDHQHFRPFAGIEWQALIIDDDQGTRSAHHRPRFSEIKRQYRNALGRDIRPNVRLGPVGQWKHANRFAPAYQSVEYV